VVHCGGGFKRRREEEGKKIEMRFHKGAAVERLEKKADHASKGTLLRQRGLVRREGKGEISNKK